MTLSKYTGELLKFEIQPAGSVILAVSDPDDDYEHYVTIKEAELAGIAEAELAGIAEAAAVRRETYATAHGAGHWPEPRKPGGRRR
jgi:hypothetical protein